MMFPRGFYGNLVSAKAVFEATHNSASATIQIKWFGGKL